MLVRVIAALSIAYSYRNDFIGRIQILFDGLALICVGALLFSLYLHLRQKNNKTPLLIASASGGLFYLGKLILFSVTDWVVYLISPASLTSYHIPFMIFLLAMLVPWLIEKDAA